MHASPSGLHFPLVVLLHLPLNSFRKSGKALISFVGGNPVVFLRISLVSILGAAMVVPVTFASTVHRPPTSGQTVHHKHSAHKRARRVRGQQAIDPDRARQIQSALIREHYLTGDPSGKWDPATIAAMQKYQADQGWQTKLMPDSRALKKLGLGADYSDAINSKNASFNPPPPVSTIPAAQAAGFTSASGSATASAASGPGIN